jgi:nickel-dependent lactate racemase
MVIGEGREAGLLSEQDVRRIVAESLAEAGLEGKRVLVLIPDDTRTAPMGLMFRLIYEAVGESAERLDYLVALGTHPPMPEEAILKRVEITREEWQRKYGRARFFNHAWDDPGALTEIGRFSESEIDEISGGLFRLEVPITVNKMVLDYDVLLIVGPVFPHEVVGFSGGNKYIFPGISGEHVLNFFHWLSAVITNPVINGNKWTPVRKIFDRAAQRISVPRLALCMVVKDGGLAGLYFGEPEEAWSQAADLSGKLQIEYKDRPYHMVLSRAPQMYHDIWLAGKCMYKLEPVVADGGTLIIYAPHLSEISYTHGRILDEIGYHTRDYFLKQWDRFKHYPWCVLAHSTHVKGIGSYEDGVEKPRANVVLATGIPEERCRRVNLGYMDPASIRLQEYMNREDEGVLYVPKAGEILYRLKDAPPHLGGKG